MTRDESCLIANFAMGICYLGEVTGGVASPAVPSRRHSDTEAVAHQPVPDVLSMVLRCRRVVTILSNFWQFALKM